MSPKKPTNQPPPLPPAAAAAATAPTNCPLCLYEANPVEANRAQESNVEHACLAHAAYLNTAASSIQAAHAGIQSRGTERMDRHRTIGHDCPSRLATNTTAAAAAAPEMALSRPTARSEADALNNSAAYTAMLQRQIGFADRLLAQKRQFRGPQGSEERVVPEMPGIGGGEGASGGAVGDEEEGDGGVGKEGVGGERFGSLEVSAGSREAGEAVDGAESGEPVGEQVAQPVSKQQAKRARRAARKAEAEKGRKT